MIGGVFHFQTLVKGWAWIIQNLFLFLVFPCDHNHAVPMYKGINGKALNFMLYERMQSKIQEKKHNRICILHHDKSILLYLRQCM
jgi:hypothetical protein